MNVLRDACDITWRDIRWEPEVLPRLEDLDILTLDSRELLGYVADIKDDLKAVRELLSVALARIVEQRDQLACKDRQIESLRRENRTMRERVQ